MISSCPLYLVYHQYTFHTDPPKMPKRQQMVQRRQCPRMEPVIDRLYRCQSEIFLNLSHRRVLFSAQMPDMLPCPLHVDHNVFHLRTTPLHLPLHHITAAD